MIKLTEKSRAAARREKCLESSFHLASKIDLKHEEFPFLLVQTLKQFPFRVTVADKNRVNNRTTLSTRGEAIVYPKDSIETQLFKYLRRDPVLNI